MASGSPPPARAATAISRATLVNMAPRLASLAPFWRLIVDHLECPDIGREYTDYHRSQRVPSTGAGHLTFPSPRPVFVTPIPRSPRGTARDDVEEPRPRPHPQRRARRATPEPARPRSRSRCSSGPARSRAWAGSTTGRPTSTTSPRSRSSTSSLSLAVGTFEHGEHEITVVDTPGYPDFIGRDDPGLPRRRRRAVRDRRLGRRRGRARGGGQASDGRPGPPPASCSTSATARTPTRPPRSTPCARPSATKIAPLHLAIGAARHVQRLRRPRPSQGLQVRGRQGGRDPGPGRARRRGGAAAGPAARGRGRGRRRRVREVPRRGGDLATRSSTRASTRASGSRSSRRCSSPPRPRASASTRCSTRSSATCPRPRRRARTPRPTRRARTSRSRPTGGQLLVRVFKTAADPFVGRLTYLRVLSGTLKSQGTMFNADQGRGRAHRPAAVPPRQGAGAGGGAAGGRDRRRRQARRDRDRRHARRPGTPRSKLGRRSTSPIRRSRSRSIPCPRATSTRWARRSSGCSRRSRRRGSSGPTPASRSCARSARRRSRSSPSASSASSAPRSRPGRPTVPYRETIRGNDQGPRPVQEADRRARHVRRRVDRARAQPRRPAWSSPTRSSAARSPRASSRASRRASARRPPRAWSRAIPLVDFKATLYDGSFHPVDSNELSFKIAASMALKDGVLQAKPVLLEPIMTVEVRDPGAVHGRGQPRPQRPPRARARAWTPRTGSR